MDSYTTGIKIFVTKTCGSSNGSYSAVERQYKREFSVCVALSRCTTYRTVKHFGETGNLLYRSRMGRGRSTSVRTEEFVGVAREAIVRNPKNSVVRAAQQMRSQSARHGKSAVMTCRCFRTKRN
jgi:hypothetical protein